MHKDKNKAETDSSRAVSDKNTPQQRYSNFYYVMSHILVDFSGTYCLSSA
jgi:hypothetical protein